HLPPRVPRDRLAVLVVKVDGIDELTVDVELKLSGGAVSDAHRAGAAIAVEVRELDLGELVAPVDAVHDLERPARSVLLGHAIGEKVHEARSLARVTETQECVDRESRVADPGVTIIPVPDASDFLRKAGRRRCDDRAARVERQQLEHESGTLNHLAPAALIAGQ